MVFGKFVTDKKDLELVQKIGETVFVKELGLEACSVMADAFALSAVVYDGDVPAGMGRMMFDGDRFTIADVAILPEFRRQKYGDFMVRLLVDKGMMSNAQEIHLDALEGTEGFFAGIGFEADGERFESLGGVWHPMVLRTDRIHKCSGCAR